MPDVWKEGDHLPRSIEMPRNEFSAADDILINEIDLAIPGFRLDLLFLAQSLM